tara:strand:+ start:14 stop:190 length:177 start_codon:yes stop_codon:yes gene_type:complete
MSEKIPYLEVINPCVQICTTDADSGLCIGCNRTEEEINNWMSLTPEQRIEIVKQLESR